MPELPISELPTPSRISDTIGTSITTPAPSSTAPATINVIAAATRPPL
jgi:hypothetical protein